MAFLRAIWRFVVGVKDVLVLLFLLLFFGGLYGALSLAGGDRPATRSHGALLLDLQGTIVEQPVEQDPFALMTAGSAPLREYRLSELVRALDAARQDSHVKAVVLNLDGFMGGGQVALARVGAALDGVRAAGKPVLAFATAYEDDGYLLAAHASEVWLNPIGGVALMGPGGSQLYYKGLLDKLGVTAHIYRVGSFKSAVEPFLREDMSSEARAANQALADALWRDWQADVRKARPKAQVATYAGDTLAAARASRGDLATAALRAGLVDRLGDETAFAERVAQLAGEDDAADGPGFAALQLDAYSRAHAAPATGDIGVLTVAGEIVDGEAGPGIAAGESIARLLREALEQGDIKALVVRIDSPGGSVLASEQIRSAVLAARAQGLPVVASMGNVAASGGYWIATGADRIYAQPSTITGSIGVFGILPSFEQSLAKIGVTSDGVATTPLSGEPDLAGGPSPQFHALAQLGVEDVYRRFLALVSKARKLPPAQVDRIAQGRVWDGASAKKLGLVDQFGGLEAAVAEAARLAKLDPASARIRPIEPEPDELSLLLRRWSEGEEARAALPRDLIAREAWRQRHWALRALEDARLLASGGGVKASCLACAAYAPPRAHASATLAPGAWSGLLTLLR